MKRFSLLALGCCVVAPALVALDTQVFYRAGLLPDVPRQFEKKQPIQISLRGANGTTRDAFDGHEKKTALFNAHGAFDVLRLGNNLENLTAGARPETYRLWHPTTGVWRSAVVDAATTAGTIGANDGKIVYSGHLEATDVALQAQVPFFYGLYVQAFVPFSKLTVSGIAPTNQGSGTVLGESVSTFLSTSLPLILAENDFTPFGEVHRDLNVGDPVISLGWEGYSARLAPLVTEVAGYMQLGVSLPAAPGKDQRVAFDLPRGYNGHLGCIGRGALEASFFDCITVGLQAGSSIFFPERRTVRLKTDKAQNGWLVLEKVRVKEDYGSIWDVGGYLAVTKIVKGLRALVGYTFTSQEVTSYNVRDADYLKTYVAAQLAAGKFISPDDYANSDARLKSWETHVLRGALQVNTAEMFGSSLGALASVEYSIPVLGKYSWATDMIGGSLGCSFMLNF